MATHRLDRILGGADGVVGQVVPGGGGVAQHADHAGLRGGAGLRVGRDVAGQRDVLHGLGHGLHPAQHTVRRPDILHLD